MEKTNANDFKNILIVKLNDMPNTKHFNKNKQRIEKELRNKGFKDDEFLVVERNVAFEYITRNL